MLLTLHLIGDLRLIISRQAKAFCSGLNKGGRLPACRETTELQRSGVK